MTNQDNLEMHSPNLVDENTSKIAELFPHCVTEAKDDNGNLKRVVDFDLLRQELSQSLVEGGQERYRLDWPGKRQAILEANTPIAMTLRPVREESVNFDTTENLFIEGDNLDALKLLQESYLGQVKMIYIDPPYNLGDDQIYKDDFSENTSDFLQRSEQVDEDGNRLVTNTESNGRFHSDWLTMMYSRLKLSRNLLKEDGVIFISINNKEVSNLQKICNEIYGENNFVECITWNKRVPKNDKGIGNIHDFLLVYTKNHNTKQEFVMLKDGLDEVYRLLDKLKSNQVSIPDAEQEVKKLYKKGSYDRGITLYNSLTDDYKLWGKINMSWPNADTFGPRYEVLHPKTRNPVKVPDRGWRWKKSTFEKAAGIESGQYQNIIERYDGSFVCGDIWFAKDEYTQPSSITYLDNVNYFLLRSILSLKSNGGIEVENLFNQKNYFSYPKPTSLLEILIKSIKLTDELIVDFFAGSSTTAHAVMQLNAQDNGNRKFIMVQLDEPINEKKQKSAYKFCLESGLKTNIAEISKERIRRAGKKVLEDNKDKEGIEDLDIGFRVLKIDNTNMEKVYYTPDEYSQDLLDNLESHIKEDRTSEDLLFQVMLDWGVPLSLPIEVKEIQGHPVYYVGFNSLVACFDTLTTELVNEIAKDEPLKFVTSERAISHDQDKTNIKARFAQLSPDTDVRFI